MERPSLLAAGAFWLDDRAGPVALVDARNRIDDAAATVVAFVYTTGRRRGALAN